MSEAEEVRQWVSKLTRANFQITDPGRYALQPEKVKWFFWCPEITEMREIPYLNVVWADKSGNIYLDSMPVGNTTDWVESAYGEEAARRSMDMDFADFSRARDEFERAFPLVGKRITEYEKTASDVSTRRNLLIDIFYHGRKGRATLRLRGRIPAGDSSTGPVWDRIEATVKALKEAFDSLQTYEAEEAGQIHGS